MHVVAASAARAEATGFLDTGFFSDGKITVAPSGGDPHANAVAAAPDGRVVIAGTRFFANGQSTLFWYSLSDTATGTICSPISPGGGLFASANAATFDSDGRLVVVGTASFAGTGYDVLILRYLYPACTLDSSFSGDGVYTVGLNQAEHLSDVAIDGQDRIVAAGDILDGSSNQRLLVLRLQINGTPDTSFSGDGRFDLDWGAGADFGQVVIQDDGKIVAGGTIDGGALGTVFAVVRLTSGGVLDSTFSGDGALAFDFPYGEDDRLTDLAIDPVTGRVLAAGASDDADTGTTRSAVARLTSTGTLDSTFDGDGVWVDNVYDVEAMASIVPQSDGRILLAGDAANVGADRNFFAYRLDHDGGVDSGFGFFGVSEVAFDLGGVDDDLGLAGGLQAGKLVIAGSAETAGETQAAVARLWSSFIFADGFERGSTRTWLSTAP
ncbi:MAG: hypothetical protein U0610_10470 [bacterium]